MKAKQTMPLIFLKNIPKLIFNSIVRIDITLNKKDIIIGTGFFIKFKLKNKMNHFLMTCHYIVEEKYVNKKMNISLYYGEVSKEEKLEIQLDSKERYIKCFDKPFDITLIEILEKDNLGEDKFLVPDWSYKNGYDFYKKNYFYLAGYPQNILNENDRSTSSGQITEILEKPEFQHSLDTGPGNSGSPICLFNNLFVVGIHKAGIENKPINYGTFLGYTLDNLENEEKNKTKINKEVKGNSLEKNKEKKDAGKSLKTSNLKQNIKSIDIIKKLFSNLDKKN